MAALSGRSRDEAEDEEADRFGGFRDRRAADIVISEGEEGEADEETKTLTTRTHHEEEEEEGETDDFDEDRPWLFVQLADSQLGLLNASDPGCEEDWATEAECLRLAVSKINAMKPKPAFVVVCGDLINEFPAGVGRAAASVSRADRQVRDFKSICAAFDPSIRLVCVCGNHDVGDFPTKASIDLFTSRFGDDYGVFDVMGTRCVVLNSQLYSLREAADDEDDDDSQQAGETTTKTTTTSAALALADAQDAWLRRELRRASRRRRTLVFKHIPPFIFEPDERKGYFNMRPDLRHALLDTLRASGDDVKIFCGHLHRNAGGWFKRDLEVVVTSAVGTTLGWDPAGDKLGISGLSWEARRCDPDTSGFRCVCVGRGQVRHRWFPLNEVPRHFDLDTVLRSSPPAAPGGTCSPGGTGATTTLISPAVETATNGEPLLSRVGTDGWEGLRPDCSSPLAPEPAAT